MVTTSDPPPAAVQRPRVSENRRSNKPIMEKRRRARINNCLNELKSLILDAMKKDPARHSKLEKADILEMTVKHVETLQRHHSALAAAADPSVVNKFKAGWGECVVEVGKFPGLDLNVKRRLVEHLSTCMENRPAEGHVPLTPRTTPSSTPSSSPSRGSSPASTTHPNLVLVPASTTRLPNGEYAFVISSPSPPSSSLSSPPPSLASMPHLVPHSAQPHPTQPLALVVNKGGQRSPWRPW
ncbi:Protein asunder [Nesidiocoris tenuis]|nr:Protein asunder [Nesidiocoris tenuis]